MTSKTRVLQIIECGGPGGTGNQVQAICKGLDRARFEVHLAYAVRPGADHAAWAKEAGADAVHHIPEMVREIAPKQDFAALQHLRRLIRDIQPKVVHAHSSKAGYLGRLAAKSERVPRVFYSPHGYGFLQLDRSRTSRMLYEFLERSVAGIGETVAIGESEALYARKQAHARKIRVIHDAYLGAVPPEPEPREGGSVLVCALGRMSFPRNPEAFVKLAQRLTDSRNNVRCLWIGGGELETVAREMARDMNLLGGKLEITGWLPREQALARLRAADICVHFSRWEGLPNAVLDAMACSLPVVASDIPGNRDLVRPETGILSATEVDTLEHVLGLVADPKRRQALGAAGRQAVLRDYSQERMLRELSDLYSQ